MVKNMIAIVVGCVYVALSVWLVRHEGKTYREDLRLSRPAKSATSSPVIERNEGAELASKAGVTPMPSDPSSPAADFREKITKAVAPAPAPSKLASEPPSPEPGTSVVSLARPGEHQSAQLASLKPAGATAREKLLARLDPFWQQPELTKKWDLSNLSPPDEMRLGGQLHDMILQFNQRVQSGPWLERVEALAKPILANRARKEIEYTFTILDSEVVNAFSHPGGYIYLSRGFFSFLGEDEDAALQFVLAHEIAHVDIRHMIQCLRYPSIQNAEMGTLAAIYFLILPLGYLDNQEYAADTWAYQQLRRLDQSRYDALKFLRKLKGYAQAHEFYDGRAPYKPGAGTSPVENHLRAHTPAWKRLNHLEEFIDQASTKPK
jgi:Peptidase family M48